MVVSCFCERMVLFFKKKFLKIAGIPPCDREFTSLKTAVLPFPGPRQILPELL